MHVCIALSRVLGLCRDADVLVQLFCAGGHTLVKPSAQVQLMSSVLVSDGWSHGLQLRVLFWVVSLRSTNSPSLITTVPPPACAG
jgi:hypothetical protein